jgi:tripartite-type tricarboxylate transporter receptor subunit TctC
MRSTPLHVEGASLHEGVSLRLVSKFRLLIAAVTSVALGSLALTSSAADYPDRPLRLIVPFSPGGLSDTGARLVAERMGQVLGQPVIVDNRAGAGGNIGTQAVAVAPADGYTLLLGFDGTLVINPHVYSKVPFNPLTDFAPIGKIGDVAPIIVVNPAVPAKNFQELVAYAKTREGGVSYGSSGVGSTGHLLVEMLNRRTGANFVHVPYKGGAQALADVVGGTLQMNSTSVAGAYPFIRQGQVRAIAVATAHRLTSLPDVPTLAESGLPGFELSGWIGLLAPAKTPPNVLSKLQSALHKALQAPELQERLVTLGIAPTLQTPSEFAAQIRVDLDRYGAIVKAAHVRLD